MLHEKIVRAYPPYRTQQGVLVESEYELTTAPGGRAMIDENNDRPTTYSDAGVDTSEGARAVDAIRAKVQSTYRPEVIGDIGGFGGLFSAASFKEMAEPILVSGTDGVGTKLKVAQLLDRHDTVGIDLVAMCANDILVTGAEPLFFLDYIAIGKLDSDKVASIVSGIAEGCTQAGCSLIGGEMAEHPGVMPDEDYDLSGFCVGVVDKPRIDRRHHRVPGRRRFGARLLGNPLQRLLARTSRARRRSRGRAGACPRWTLAALLSPTLSSSQRAST